MGASLVEDVRELLVGVDNWRAKLTIRRDDVVRHIILVGPRDGGANGDDRLVWSIAEVVDGDRSRALCGGARLVFQHDVCDRNLMIDVVKRQARDAEYLSQAIRLDFHRAW